MKIKPCPFCGEEATTFQMPACCPEGGMWAIGCNKDMACFGHICHRDELFASEDEAIERWNRRANIEDSNT